MFTEGEGWKSPYPIMIIFDEAETSQIKTECKVLARHKASIPYHDWFIGKLGEAAWSKYLNQQLGVNATCDFSLFRGGDGGIDIEAFGITTQVKSHRAGGQCLVKRVSKDKKLLPLRANLFAFSEIMTIEQETQQQVQLIGYLSLRDLERYGKPTLAHLGTHFNLYIDERYLEPAKRWITYLAARRELRRA